MSTEVTTDECRFWQAVMNEAGRKIVTSPDLYHDAAAWLADRGMLGFLKVSASVNECPPRSVRVVDEATLDSTRWVRVDRHVPTPQVRNLARSHAAYPQTKGNRRTVPKRPARR